MCRVSTRIRRRAFLLQIAAQRVVVLLEGDRGGYDLDVVIDQVLIRISLT